MPRDNIPPGNLAGGTKSTIYITNRIIGTPLLGSQGGGPRAFPFKKTPPDGIVTSVGEDRGALIPTYHLRGVLNNRSVVPSAEGQKERPTLI